MAGGAHHRGDDEITGSGDVLDQFEGGIRSGSKRSRRSDRRGGGGLRQCQVVDMELRCLCFENIAAASCSETDHLEGGAMFIGGRKMRHHIEHADPDGPGSIRGRSVVGGQADRWRFEGCWASCPDSSVSGLKSRRCWSKVISGHRGWIAPVPFSGADLRRAIVFEAWS